MPKVPSKVAVNLDDSTVPSVVGLPSLQNYSAVSPPVPAYLYKATFQVIDQVLSDGALGPSEGFEIGAWDLHQVDGTAQIVGNVLQFEPQTTPSINDHILQGTTAIARTFGLPFKIVTNSTNLTWRMGFTDTLNSLWSKYPHIYLVSSELSVNSSSNYEKMTNPSPKEIICVLGGFNSSGEPYKQGDTKANFLYGARFFLKTGSGSLHPTYELVAVEHRFNEPSLYPAMLNYNQNVFMTELKVPDPSYYVVPDSMMEPKNLSLFDAANGTDVAASYVPDVGAGFTAYNGGVAEVQSSEAVFTTAGDMIITAEGDGIFNQPIRMPASGSTPGGILFRQSDANNAWYVKITPGGSPNLELIEINAGVPTQRAFTTITLNASTTYWFLVTFKGDNNVCIDVDGTRRLLYSTTNTFNQSATGVGFKDEGANNFGFPHTAFFDKARAQYETEGASI